MYALTRVWGEFLAHMHCSHHRRNLVNNTGGGGEIRPWVLGTLIYVGVELEIRGRLV